MRKFRLSVHQYRAKMETEFGFADPEMVQRYADAKSQFKRGLIDGTENVFAPCKGCGNKDKQDEESK